MLKRFAGLGPECVQPDVLPSHEPGAGSGPAEHRSPSSVRAAPCPHCHRNAVRARGLVLLLHHHQWEQHEWASQLCPHHLAMHFFNFPSHRGVNPSKRQEQSVGRSGASGKKSDVGEIPSKAAFECCRAVQE